MSLISMSFQGCSAASRISAATAASRGGIRFSVGAGKVPEAVVSGVAVPGRLAMVVRSSSSLLPM
jgi:hypothetical protein